MPFPDAEVGPIMVILSNIIVLGTEWSVMPKVETRFEIEVLCPADALRKHQQDGNKQCLFFLHIGFIRLPQSYKIKP